MICACLTGRRPSVQRRDRRAAKGSWGAREQGSAGRAGSAWNGDQSSRFGPVQRPPPSTAAIVGHASRKPSSSRAARRRVRRRSTFEHRSSLGFGEGRASPTRSGSSFHQSWSFGLPTGRANRGGSTFGQRSSRAIEEGRPSANAVPERSRKVDLRPTLCRSDRGKVDLRPVGAGGSSRGDLSKNCGREKKTRNAARGASTS